MSASAITNSQALKKREFGQGEWCKDTDGSNKPKRWAGTVKDEIAYDEYRNEWQISIESEALQKPVVAWVNENRSKGTKVQFCLIDTDPSGKTAGGTWFETTKGEKNPLWLENQVHWSRWTEPHRGDVPDKSSNGVLSGCPGTRPSSVI